MLFSQQKAPVKLPCPRRAFLALVSCKVSSLQVSEVARKVGLFKSLLRHMLSLLFWRLRVRPFLTNKVKRCARQGDRRATLLLVGCGSIALALPSEAPEGKFCSERRPI